MKEYILSSCASIISMYFILNNNYIKNLFNSNKTQPKQTVPVQKSTISPQIEMQALSVNNKKNILRQCVFITDL